MVISKLFTKFEKGKDGYCYFDVNTYLKMDIPKDLLFIM